MVTLKQKQMVEMTILSNDHGLQSPGSQDLHPDNPLLAVWTSTTYIICEVLLFSFQVRQAGTWGPYPSVCTNVGPTPFWSKGTQTVRDEQKQSMGAVGVSSEQEGTKATSRLALWRCRGKAGTAHDPCTRPHHGGGQTT